MYLYDNTNNHNVVAYSDDDGVTLDSYVGYTNTTAGSTYYAQVNSYTGEGGPSSFYTIKAVCNAQGEQHGGTTPTSGITGTWTVMLYLNAEDSSFADILTKYRTDIESFIGAKRSFLTVTVLYDPPGNTGITRYVVQPNGNYTNGVNRWTLAEANMGDPDTLNNFVSWSMDQFPADNYYLAIDDHGNGAYGISFDATSWNDPLTPPEVYSALKGATQNGARKIDILDYEACLMGLAENAYDVKSLVHYLVASEQISWGIDTYPTYFRDLTSNTSPLTVGQRVVTRYSATAAAAGYPHTMALIDTTQLGTVNTAVNGFANALMATGNYTGVVKTARANSQAFAADAEATDSGRADYIDLWSLADHTRIRRAGIQLDRQCRQIGRELGGDHRTARERWSRRDYLGSQRRAWPVDLLSGHAVLVGVCSLHFWLHLSDERRRAVGRIPAMEPARHPEGHARHARFIPFDWRHNLYLQAFCLPAAGTQVKSPFLPAVISRREKTSIDDDARFITDTGCLRAAQPQPCGTAVRGTRAAA